MLNSPQKSKLPGQGLGDKFYAVAIKPSAMNEDHARREYIFNILIFGMFLLSLITFFISFVHYIINESSYQNIKPLFLAIPVVTLLIIFLLSRRKFSNFIIYFFISIVTFLGTCGLYLHGYVLPESLLIYALVIVISGILISAAAALLLTVFIIISLCALFYLQLNHVLYPHTSELNDPLRMNLTIYIFIFLTIYLVSWLYTREVERSLNRARKSEKLLAKERDILEIKIKERAKELEKVQLEKVRELYRFAEFGRFSSSLIHDFANPLTAVSLNLDNLNGKHKPKALRQIQRGVQYMEEYVASARRQLNNQIENKWFDSAEIIGQVISFLVPKAKSSRVKIKRNLKSNVHLYGDSTKFSQIISNLIGNAIDAYENNHSIAERVVMIKLDFNLSKDKICISIRDHGKGIPQKELGKLFEPFFSTKPAGRGIGIGLTITKRIIEEDFNGKIEVSSRKSQGTVFKLFLPIGKVK